MQITEKKKKLTQLPWQAIYNLAIEKGIEEEGLKSKTRSEIIDAIFLDADVSDDTVNKLLENYIYGDRVTFTLWYFSKGITSEQLNKLKQLEMCSIPEIDVNGFRRFCIQSIQSVADRYEVIYTYSKEYMYLNEEGKDSTIWEMHRGCVWIGINKPYLACISKHENMTKYVTDFIASSIGNTVTQIKPPKKSIEKCTKIQAKSRVTIQDFAGAKTTFSCSTGLTDDQKNEEERLRTKNDTFDTSGNYIAEISDGIVGTVKHNIHKGSIGIYKHLPADVLFEWTANAISIILQDIDALKGKPVSEIYESLGVQLKWTIPFEKQPVANWILTNIIASIDENQVEIPLVADAEKLLEDEDYFIKVPRVYCSKCESYEVPVCSVCSKILKSVNKGLFCECGAPVELMCSEGHKGVHYTPWYIPTKKLKCEVRRNLSLGYQGLEDDITFLVIGNDLVIKHGLVPDDEVEVQFSDIKEFQIGNEEAGRDRRLQEYAVKMKEKCGTACSFSKIEKCVDNPNMVCLPKVFMGFLPGFRVQPHKGAEFGDIHGQVTVGKKHYMLKGIIKKNSINSGNKKINDMITKPLLETSHEGEEIIRQFVTQGMQDNRAQLIAIVAPQRFDQNVQATIDYLARLGNKKVVYIGLEQLCQLLSKSPCYQLSV